MQIGIVRPVRAASRNRCAAAGRSNATSDARSSWWLLDSHKMDHSTSGVLYIGEEGWLVGVVCNEASMSSARTGSRYKHQAFAWRSRATPNRPASARSALSPYDHIYTPGEYHLRILNQCFAPLLTLIEQPTFTRIGHEPARNVRWCSRHVYLLDLTQHTADAFTGNVTAHGDNCRGQRIYRRRVFL